MSWKKESEKEKIARIIILDVVCAFLVVFFYVATSSAFVLFSSTVVNFSSCDTKLAELPFKGFSGERYC